jgi:hypothetical protein
MFATRFRDRPLVWLTVGLAAVLVTSVVSSVPQSYASSYAESFVTMVSHRGDYIGQGNSRYFHPGNTSFFAQWGDHVRLVVDGGSYGERFNFHFAAADGKRLEVGVYERAQAWPSQEPGRPGMDIFGEGRACREVTGRFVVKDIELTEPDTVSRLWILFQFSCEGADPPLIGEIRIGIPGDGGDLIVGPRAVRWPNLPAGGVAAVVPVRAVNTSTSSLGVASASLKGSRDMKIRLDECSGMTLASNESCAVWVRFSPSDPGIQKGRLRITETSGFAHITTFKGKVAGQAEVSPIPGRPGGSKESGSSLFSFRSDPGDYIGQGEERSFDSSNADFFVTGNHHGIDAEILTHGDALNWSATFVPVAGDILAPGLIFLEARRAVFEAGRAGLDISGEARGCNTLEGEFTVHAMRMNDFGKVVEFAASFEQHCEGREPALRGMFRYQNTQPAPTLSPYPSPTTQPVVSPIERSISLVIRGRRATGVVNSSEPQCQDSVRVKLQRKRARRFRTVANLGTTETGRFKKRIGQKFGLYRAVVPKEVLNTNEICARAASKPVRY